jgi:hypothetical protein
LVAWFRQTLEDNDCVLLSVATGSGAGINAKYVITTTQNIKENEDKYQVKKGKAFDETKRGTNLQNVLANETAVFSFRFAGSLVESIDVAKTDTTNSAAIAANFALLNNPTDGAETQSNETKGAEGPVATTAEDRQRNLLAIYAQMQNVSVKCMAHPWLGPGDYAFVKGLGFFDGRYQILTVTHRLEGHRFTSQLEGARLLPNGNEDDQTANKGAAQSNGKQNFTQPVVEQKKSNPNKEFAAKKVGKKASPNK